MVFVFLLLFKSLFNLKNKVEHPWASEPLPDVLKPFVHPFIFQGLRYLNVALRIFLSNTTKSFTELEILVFCWFFIWFICINFQAYLVWDYNLLFLLWLKLLILGKTLLYSDNFGTLIIKSDPLFWLPLDGPFDNVLNILTCNLTRTTHRKLLTPHWLNACHSWHTLTIILYFKNLAQILTLHVVYFLLLLRHSLCFFNLMSTIHFFAKEL